MTNQTNQLMLDLFLAADAVLGAAMSKDDVGKLREVLATGLVQVHVELVIDERGASGVIGRISQPGRKTGTLFHLTKRDEPEEKTIIEPSAFTHLL
jgi:hypothetical protein